MASPMFERGCPSHQRLICSESVVASRHPCSTAGNFVPGILDFSRALELDPRIADQVYNKVYQISYVVDLNRVITELNKIVAETKAPAPKFEIITATPTLLPTHNRKVQRIFHELCKERNIQVRCGEKVSRVEPGIATTDSGATIAFEPSGQPARRRSDRVPTARRARIA